jgi:hypothetical protein
MTTLTINQDNFWKVLDKLYSIVSSSGNDIVLQYETVNNLDNAENKNIINYLKSENWDKELKRTEKLLNNII